MITACICEGGAERAIIEILLEHDLLIFNSDELLDGVILRCRDAKTFESRYLRKGFTDTIRVYRILDSRRENFKLSAPYAQKVEVVNVITAPEIEMLIIASEGRRDDYLKKSRRDASMKPSTYCKSVLKYSNVKTYDFVHEYFEDINKLMKALQLYKSKSKIRKGEKTIYDLLK